MTAPFRYVPGQDVPYSSALNRVINAVGRVNSRTLTDVQTRRSEFGSTVESYLAGIYMDPATREVANQTLENYWGETRNNYTEADEVIIGSGFHAAVYAANRVIAGHPRPLVLERSGTVGGTFAMSSKPMFRLNSRNRAGYGGMAGDDGASLNYLPGAPIQAASLSMDEYQSNAEMAYVIRMTLAQYANVRTLADVTRLNFNDTDGQTLTLADGSTITANLRTIDARGLGSPVSEDKANGVSILTFPQFMARMSARTWPLQGLRRVAVIGGGDSAKCAVESLLGLAPQSGVSVSTLDKVERIDWYTAGNLPDNCEGWRERVRGRYAAIGRYLRADRYGVQRINMVQNRVSPTALATGLALVGGRMYDAVVMCTGSAVKKIPGLDDIAFSGFRGVEYDENAEVLATVYPESDVMLVRVGPRAGLTFNPRERADGVASVPENAVAMFRTAGKTAAIASVLPGIELDGDDEDDDEEAFTTRSGAF